MTQPTIVSRVASAQLRAVAAVATFAVVTGGAAGTWTAVRRDDATSIAIARVLRVEVTEHISDDADLGAEVQDEVHEDRGFGRQIEVYRGAARIGGDERSAVLGPAMRALDGCETESHAGKRWRVCTVAAPGGIRIEVGAPLGPLTETIAIIAGSIALTTLLAVLAFALINRRAVQRTLSPLARLEQGIADLNAATLSRRLGRAWGVAEVDALATAFDSLLERVEEALQRERRFLLDVSHELRTPLTRLRAQIELACEECTENTALGVQLRSASAACTMLVQVTESVLALARSEVPHDQAVDVSDVVRSHCSSLDPALAARVEIGAPDEALVRADAALIRLAVGNLINNALKFSTGAVTVHVSDHDAVTCRVDDAGPGIPEAERARVFEPFFRGDAARGRTPGVGLGLALVRHIATAYGGNVTLAQAGKAHGLRAELTLPRWKPSSG